MKLSKYYKPNGIYQDRAGTCYTIVYTPEIKSYFMTRLQSNNERISNDSVVFSRWIPELKYIGSFVVN